MATKLSAHPWAIILVAPVDGPLLRVSHLRIPGGRSCVEVTRAAHPPTASGDGWSALVLRWDERLVPDGWDRLTRALRREAQPLVVHAWHPRVEQVLREAETAVCVGLADRVVVLDLVDGRLVERAP